MLGGELDVWGAHWELQYLLVSVSTEVPTLEEYKHWASVQSLFLLLKTGYGLNTATESKSMWGANAHSVLSLHQVKRMHHYSFCHCLYAQGANSLYAGSYSLEHLNSQLGRELDMQECVDTVADTLYTWRTWNTWTTCCTLTDTAKKLYNARTIINTSFKCNQQGNTT